jgi:Sigma-70 region 2
MSADSMLQTLIIAMCGALQANQFKDALSEDVHTQIAIIRDMSPEQLQDEELVAKCRAAADIPERDLYVNELFRRNYAKVARWCLRFTDDRETAADLAQEIFTKAYRNIHRNHRGQHYTARDARGYIVGNGISGAAPPRHTSGRDAKAIMNVSLIACVPTGILPGPG